MYKAKQFPMIVNGNSMYPSICSGNCVIVKAADVDMQYEVGDVIVFHYHGEKVVHRIIRVSLYHIVCKGDNTGGLELIHKSDVIGKVTKVCASNREK